MLVELSYLPFIKDTCNRYTSRFNNTFRGATTVFPDSGWHHHYSVDFLLDQIFCDIVFVICSHKINQSYRVDTAFGSTTDT